MSTWKLDSAFAASGVFGINCHTDLVSVMQGDANNLSFARLSAAVNWRRSLRTALRIYICSRMERLERYSWVLVHSVGSQRQGVYSNVPNRTEHLLGQVFGRQHSIYRHENDANVNRPSHPRGWLTWSTWNYFTKPQQQMNFAKILEYS